MENPDVDFSLHIINGQEDGSHRVSSGRAWLNGDQIAGPSDFSRRVELIDRNVSLQEENQLRTK